MFQTIQTSTQLNIKNKTETTIAQNFDSINLLCGLRNPKRTKLSCQLAIQQHRGVRKTKALDKTETVSSPFVNSETQKEQNFHVKQQLNNTEEKERKKVSNHGESRRRRQRSLQRWVAT